MFLAHQETYCDKNDPNYNATDGKIYKRIVPTDQSSDEEDDMIDPMKSLQRPLATMEDMDNFIESQHANRQLT